MIGYLEISLFFPHYKRFCTHYGTFHKNEPLTYLSGIEIVVNRRAHLRSRIGKYEKMRQHSPDIPLIPDLECVWLHPPSKKLTANRNPFC